MPASAVSRRSSSGPSSAGLGGVSPYERAASLLISLLVLLGLSVAVLLFVWLGSKFSSRTRTVPVVLEPEKSGGSPLGASPDGQTLEAPSVQEVQRQAQLALPEFRSTLAAVDDLLANRRAELETTLDRLENESVGGGRSTGTGNAPAFGDGAGTGGLSRSQRWELRFASDDTLDGYRRELDYFGIELAAVAADGRIEYVRGFSRSQPTVDRARAAPETRLYMQWRRGSPRLAADRKLLESAGVDVAGKTLVQFLPADLEERLARLEFDFAKREARKIRKTRFATRPAGDGFEPFVEEQIPQ